MLARGRRGANAGLAKAASSRWIIALVLCALPMLTGCFKPPVIGLRGIAPPVVYSAMPKGFPTISELPAVKFVKIDTLQPTFEWEAFPNKSAKQADNEEDLEHLKNVTYDLRIWYVVRGLPGELAYERDALPQPRHRLEKPLSPGTRYCWTVRPRFTLNGEPRVGTWAFSRLPWPPEYGARYGSYFYGSSRLEQIPPDNYYRFKTP